MPLCTTTSHTFRAGQNERTNVQVMKQLALCGGGGRGGGQGSNGGDGDGGAKTGGGGVGVVELELDEIAEERKPRTKPLRIGRRRRRRQITRNDRPHFILEMEEEEWFHFAGENS